MGRRLYVGNLPYKCTDEELTELFSRAGAVDNVRVMRDQATGRARGFAFVEMVSDDDAQKAINEFHQYQMDGRALVSYLKQNLATSAIPIVMVTTETDPRVLDPVRNLGVVAVIEKAFP